MKETPEADYVVMSEIMKEVLLLGQVQAVIMPALESSPVEIVDENPGVIKMANNSHSSKRTRHIDVKHYLIRNAMDEGKFFVTYVKTEGQHAGVLKKPLDRSMLEKYVDALIDAG